LFLYNNIKNKITIIKIYYLNIFSNKKYLKKNINHHIIKYGRKEDHVKPRLLGVAEPWAIINDQVPGW
jgi:methyl coenzyme M reductase subunit D